MRRPPAPALLLAGLMVAGFGPTNRSSFPVHQPVVSRTDYTLDLRTDGFGHLEPGEAVRASEWLGMLRLDYGDQVSVDGPEGHDDVAAVVSGFGLLLQPAAPVTAGPVPRGTARLVVSRATATVSGCPDYSNPSSPNYDAATSTDFGCATETNLARQIANPDDLVRGQTGSLGGADAQTVAKSIKLYRDQPATGTGGLKVESPSAGSSGGSH